MNAIARWLDSPWTAGDVFCVVFGLVVLFLGIFGFSAVISSARREDAASFPEPDPEPVPTWRDDLNAMAESRITLEEFCDRRWWIRTGGR